MGAYTAKIGGALVDVIGGTLAVESTLGQRAQGALRVWSAPGVLWQYGTQVLVYDDTGALAFAGYVYKDHASKPGGARQGTGFLEHDLQLMDNCYRADKRRVFKTYLAVSAGVIVADLITAYLAAEGVTSTASSIASGAIITEVIWEGTKTVSDALTWLAQQCGYWWQIDKAGVLWFQPYAGVSAPWPVDGTQVDALQDISVETGNDLYINTQYTKGAFAETATLTETLHGDGARRSFTLSYPVATIASVTLNGGDVTAKSLTKGSSGGYFYYARGDAVLAQDPSQALLTSGDSLVVTYKGRYPVIAAAKNNTLIAAQKAREGVGTGIVESCYVNPKVHTLSAAYQIAASLLAHYGQDMTLLTFTTRQSGLAPGQLVSVDLPDFALSGAQMLINGVTITDQIDGLNIYYVVTAVGSPVESAQWQTYWQNLMAQSSDPSDYTDTQDTSLALLSIATWSGAPTFTVTHTRTSCPITGNSTFANVGLLVC